MFFWFFYCHCSTSTSSAGTTIVVTAFGVDVAAAFVAPELVDDVAADATDDDDEDDVEDDGVPPLGFENMCENSDACERFSTICEI